MVEACGPVQPAEGAEYHVGAARATNNTAEMQALIEALCWLNTCAEHKGVPSSSKVTMTQWTRCTSRGSSMRSLRRGRTERWPRCSVNMRKEPQKKLQLHIRWVREHTGDVRNSTADELADLGTRVEAPASMVETSSADG